MPWRPACVQRGKILNANLISRLRAKTSSPLLSRIKRRVRSVIKNDSWIPINSVRWGDFRNPQPVCSNFGYSRGNPIDRYYIESFLAAHAGDLSGRVLEIKDDSYTRRFGGSRVKRSDVLDYDAGNKVATIHADLNDPKALESGVYDCAIITQTLQYLIEPANVLRHLHDSLKPGGVLLLTVPAITAMRGRDPWYWNYTALGAETLLGEVFQPSSVSVQSYGNLVSAIALLEGLSAGELKESELDACDPAYQVLIVARAVRAR
jgi:SAM-dependent methyltransferase